MLRRITFDQGNRFSVPYMMGASGIAVNRRQVAAYDRSWSIFDRTDLANRMTMLDDMREVIGAALKYLGYSVNSTDTAQLAKAKEVVLGWKKNIVKFDAESFAKGFAAGRVLGGARLRGEHLPGVRLHPERRGFLHPARGRAHVHGQHGHPEKCPDKEAAYAFINYIHSPQVFARIVDYLGYPCINAAARPFLRKNPTISWRT